MSYSVKERAEMVGVFRWMSVAVMETLARWVPITPEMEVKVLFGRHIWDFAQHADAFGKRAFELRAPLHFSLPPSLTCLDWVGVITAVHSTSDRIAAVYDTWIPAMASWYGLYIEHTDDLMDEPTVRLIERFLGDFQRMAGERIRLTQALKLLPPDLDVATHLARVVALVDLRPIPMSSSAPSAAMGAT